MDAQNYVTEYVDEEVIKEYIRRVRREKGVRLTRMSVVIAAYYLASLQHPYINRFVVNSRVYNRNHFCVSFVMLKKRADGTPDETTVKIFMTPEDDIFSINQRINDTIEKNSEPKHNNNTDKFASFMFSRYSLRECFHSDIQHMEIAYGFHVFIHPATCLLYTSRCV